MSAGPSKNAIAFVLITLLIDVIGLGIIVPVMPELIMELTGEGIGNAAAYGGWLMFVYALMQFIFAPVAGNLSDRFGRRPILLIGLGALTIDYLIMGFAPTLFWLVLGRLLAGIAGSTYSTASAYIADSSPPEKRAQNFALTGMAFGIGFVIGPVVGGLLGEIGPRVPFFAAAVLAFLNMLYGVFVLPESLPPENRRPFDLKRANPLGALQQVRAFPIVAGLMMAMLLYQFAHQVNPAIWSYYTGKKFDWSPKQIGLSLGAVGMLVALVQGGLIRWVIPKFGERRAALFGLFMVSCAFVGIALAPSGFVLLLWLAPLALGNLAAPSIKGIMSNQMPANAQGELQGALGAVIGISAVISPPMMTQLFKYFSGNDSGWYLPGAPYLLAAAMTALAILPVWHTTRHQPR